MVQEIADLLPQGLGQGWHDVSEEKDVATVLTLPKRTDMTLLQNCDLPPPVKVFSGEIETALNTAIYMQQSPVLGSIESRLGLLKALQLSQTRAREAEAKASVLGEEKDKLAALFIEDSSRLLAYRQWIKLLEMEILNLRACHAASDLQEKSWEKKDTRDAGSGWGIALVLCLGLAGVGLAFSWRYIA